MKTLVRYEVQFTFYLPFRLPSSAWENKSVSVPLKGYISSAVLVVLPPSEAGRYLTPVEPGEQEGYTSTPLLQSQEYLEVITVLLFDEKSDLDQIFSKENVARLQNQALEIANRFLNWCRILDEEITIKSIPFVDKIDDKGFRKLYWPWDVHFLDVKTKKTLDDRYSLQFGEMVGSRYRPKSEDLSWDLVRGKMESPPELAELLRIDAYEAWHWGNDRQFILDAATCVEIAIVRRLLRAASDKKPLERIMRGYKESFAGKYCDTLPRLLGLTALKEENPDLFQSISLLYGIRNKAIHAGKENFDRDTINRIQHSLKKVLEWCEQ